MSQQKTQDIYNHINNNDGTPSDWYVGIAADPRDRLFSDHGVQEQGDTWIYRTFDTEGMARAVEKYFIDQIGTSGGPGGGDASTKAVYAYKKRSHTRE